MEENERFIKVLKEILNLKWKVANIYLIISIT
jgi:hypothetical protein